MAIKTQYNYKGFDFEAYININTINIQKQSIIDVEGNKSSNYSINIESSVWKDDTKTNLVESDIINYAIEDISNLSIIGAYGKLKEKYPDSIDVFDEEVVDENIIEE